MRRRTWAGILVLTAAIAAAGGFGLRVGVFEWPPLAWTCAAAAPPFGCGLFRGAGIALRHEALGVLGVIAGMIAVLGGGPRVVIAGVAVSGAGLALYAPELASAGLLLASLRALRLFPRSGAASIKNPPQQDGAGEQR